MMGNTDGGTWSGTLIITNYLIFFGETFFFCISFIE